MLSISRILTLLAGALIGAVVLRKKEDSRAGAAPWRSDLEELQKKFSEHLTNHDSDLGDLQQRFESMVADLAARSDGPVVELAVRLTDLQPKIEAMTRELAAEPDGRIDELAAWIGHLQPKIEALAAGLAKPDPRVDALSTRLAEVESKTIPEILGHVADLRQTVSAHDQKLQATGPVVMAIEQMLNARMAEFEQRLEAQRQTLQAMNSSIAQSDELLERVLDLVQSAPPPAGEPREPVAIVAEGSAIRELQL